MTNTPSKDLIITMLDKWIRQRPGLEFGNYGDPVTYRAEMRSITKDGTIAKQLLRYVELRDSITAADMMAGFDAFSGRLTLVHQGTHIQGDKWALDYCTGQYWPTEYRRAVCAVLSSVIWAWWRDDVPAGTDKPGDYLRATAAREFGRGIARRFFG